jgi:protein required for attachment to host cells
MKPTVTWVLLADGAQAKVFAHSGPGTGLTAVRDLMFEEEPLKAQDIMADRPGRAFASGPQSAARSGYEYATDPVEMREANFVRQVAIELDRKFQQSAFGRLIIAAAPTALGELREALSDRLKQAVIAEESKDLTNMPTPQLEKHFDKMLVM